MFLLPRFIMEDLAGCKAELPIVRMELSLERDTKDKYIRETVLLRAKNKVLAGDIAPIKNELNDVKLDLTNEKLKAASTQSNYKWFFGGGFVVSAILTNIIWLNIIGGI